MNNLDPKKTPARDSQLPTALPEIVATNQKPSGSEMPAAPQQPNPKE